MLDATNVQVRGFILHDKTLVEAAAAYGLQPFEATHG
jgi:hypothetical protein